jgi:hypothetical protein
MRQEAQLSEIEVKEVRIPLCTSVIATSSPSELLKTHVAGKMRSENEAKAVGKNCKDRTNQVRMRALLMRACKKEKPSANSESTTKTTEECNVAASY